MILPHGVLFRGNAEGEIRKRLIKQGYIKGIIGLPANLFYGTGIPACIIVMDKENAVSRKGIFMVDASKGFIKDGNKNRLRAQDIHKIVDTFTKQIELAKYSRMVTVSEIEANDFNLNLPRYIDSSEAEDLQDIDAHLNGGIPDADIDALANYWNVFPDVRRELFTVADRANYNLLNVDAAQIKTAIFNHSEFTTFNQSVTDLFSTWQSSNVDRLTSIKQGDRAKLLIDTLSENLLETFHDVALIDPYDVYQHLMDYWAETMQDDVYMLVSDGWIANTDLIPKALIIARYFAAEQTAIENLEMERDDISRQMEELDEEHSGEDGLLFDAKNDKGKLSSKSIKERLKGIKNDSDAVEELALLGRYVLLIEKESTANKKIKDAQKALDLKVIAKYSDLSEDEIKTLVVHDKWLAVLAASVQSELSRVSQALTGRIKQLADRYAIPLPQLIRNVESLSSRVNEHLTKMGFS